MNDDEYPNKEIIVVDGGSKDKTVEISEKNGAIVILEKGENKSLPMARNQGAEYAIKGGNDLDTETDELDIERGAKKEKLT